jgi:thiol-disulfide isomerase/thioredoxin
VTADFPVPVEGRDGVAVLIALGILVGVVSVLNLALTFGVIRRLREHDELIAKGTSGGTGQQPLLPVGQRSADFTGTTTSGDPVARDLLSGDTLVAFLTPSCTPCQKRIPDLVDAARSWPGGRRDTLTVIVGDADAASEYVEQLAPVAQVVVEQPGGEIVAAFGVEAYPTFSVIDKTGTVLRSAIDPAELARPQVATA